MQAAVSPADAHAKRRLQFRHGFSTVEMRRSSRRSAEGLRLLQFGHGFSAVEMAYSLDTETRRETASIRPRLQRRGDAKSRVAVRRIARGFNSATASAPWRCRKPKAKVGGA